MSHSDRARHALARLAETDPALGALALWCQHRDGAGPTASAGETIRYGPEFAALPVHEQAGLAAHHVLHVALRHAARAEALAERLGPAFRPDLYALAADAIVNDALILAGHALPRPCVRLVELLERMGEGPGEARSALAEWDADRLAMRLHRDAATGRAARVYGAERQFTVDLVPEEGAPRHSAAEWHGHLVRAMGAGRRAGEGIGTLSAILADLAPPRVPWERRLRGALATALARRPARTFRRPAGRWVAAETDAVARGGPVPVFEPGRQRRTRRPRVVVGLDTSASIDPHTLQLFLSEASGIARRTGAEAHLLAFDEEVHAARRLDHGADALLRDLDLRTGGGTSFVDLGLRAGALRPSVLVVLTDLDGTFGPPPGCPVLWAVPGDPPAPPYGRVLRLDPL